MNGAVKIGILAGGAWLLYEWWQQQQLASVPGSIPNAALPAPTPGPLGTPAPTSSPAPAANTAGNAASLASIRTQLQTLANNWLASNPQATGLDVDNWSYFYGQIRGVPFPDWPNQAILQSLGIPLTAPGRNQVVTVDQYLTAAAPAGLSSYSRAENRALAAGLVIGRGMGAAPFLQLRNRAKVIRLPLTTPAVAAIRRGVAARPGRNYIPANTPMVRGAA